MYFVNYPLRLSLDDEDRLPRLIERGLCPELGLDAVVMETVDVSWHENNAALLDAANRPRALHLPFFDLQPGSIDPLAREAAYERLNLAFEVARIYKPRHLIGHVSYDQILYVKSYDAWVERAAEVWASLLDGWPGHPPLFLENVFETNPAHVAGLPLAIREFLDPGDESVGFCLDIGHWHSFAQGAKRENLEEWLEAAAPVLGHMHLHDNDGSFDDHKGPGAGTIPFDALFAGLDKRGLSPTFTFEPHTPDDLLRVLEFAAARPERF